MLGNTDFARKKKQLLDFLAPKEKHRRWVTPHTSEAEWSCFGLHASDARVLLSKMLLAAKTQIAKHGPSCHV